ncbi:MAG: hypothetical protein HY293_07305 [Planctomycetes bacterium]|nr:hypothetical protein [Planctomycetota bacterium]
MWRNLVRSGLIVALCVFLGRLAGFVREVLLAHVLGLGRAADLAVFTLTLPDSLTNLLMGGAIMGGAVGAVLIPEFKALQEKEPAGARNLLLDASLLGMAGFGLLAAVTSLLGPAVVVLLAPGLSGEDLPRALRLLNVSVGAIPFAAMAAVTTAYLQSRERFAIAALGTIFFNGIIIGALAGWTRPESLIPLALGVTVASAFRWITQVGNIVILPPLAPRATGPRKWSVSRSLIGRYLQALGSLGLLILAPVIARALASLDAAGSLAAVNYIHKIVELPMGIAASLLSMVLLPRFSELFVRGKTQESLDLLRQGTWLSWTLMLPITMAMGWFSLPVVGFLFGRVAMTPEDVRRIAGISAWALSALPALALNTLFFSVLSSRGDTRRPLTAGLLLFALYVAAAVWGQRQLFAPFTAAGRDLPPLRGFLIALAAGAVSLGAALLPRYRTLPAGFRSFSRKSSA